MHERNHSHGPGRPRIRRLRFHHDRTRVPGNDQVVVLGRSTQARNHQLPDLQARARRPFLRPHLRSPEGLRVHLRQVQAPQAPRRDLREVRRGGARGAGAPRAHGPHRPGHAGCAYLVSEVAALAHRADARHDHARDRAGAVFRGVRRDRPRRHRPGTGPAPDRGTQARGAGDVRPHLRGRDGRRGDPQAAAPGGPR